jgi:hypothetical protein
MNDNASRSIVSRIIASMVFCALASIPLQAPAQGWLTGGTIGTAKQHDYEVGGPIATRDESDAAARIVGGYMVSSNQGVVASYVNFGTVRYDGPAFGGFTDSLDADGIDISYLVGWAPGAQQRVSIFGTVGVVSWDQDVTYTDTTGTFKYADEGASFSVGFGTEINLSASGTSPWGINFEYQLFKDVGDANNSGHEYDRDMISVGVDYRFGR